jgi:hypothetical protein
MMEIKILARYRIKPTRRVRRRLPPKKALRARGAAWLDRIGAAPWNTELSTELSR